MQLSDLAKSVVDSAKAYIDKRFEEIKALCDSKDYSDKIESIAEDVEKLKAVPLPQKGDPGEPGHDGKDGESVDMDVLKSMIDEAVSQIEIPVPEKGDKGDPGKDADPADIVRMVNEAVSQIEIPIGEKGDQGDKGEPGKDADPEEISRLVNEAVAQIEIPVPEKGDPGEKGEKGDSVDIEEVKSLVQAAVSEIPVPKDGKDGTSVTLEDIEPLLEKQYDKWALAFERRAFDVLQSAIDRMPQAKDGQDGKDGIGFEDLTVEHDGERGFTLKFARGEEVKEYKFTVPAILDRGVYRNGQAYEKGDGVTWAGSFWIAQKDTDSKPDSVDGSWRLSVKKGRDAKQPVKVGV